MSNQVKFAQLQAFTIAGAGPIIGDTTLDLSSFESIDGVALTMTNFGIKGFMTIEPNSGTQEEQISFTGVVQNANGTATLTGISNVLFLSPYTETSGLAKTHSGGVKVVVSNTSGFYNTFANVDDDEIITGTWIFTLPNYPRMDSVAVFPTDPEQLVPKAYADSLTFNGAPNASTSVQGLVQEATVNQLNLGTGTGSTGALLFGSPADFAASIYGLQLPTSGQKSALVGDNTDIAVGSGNTFVTQTGLQHNAEKYAADAQSSDTYQITLAPAPTSYTAGMVVYFKANTVNTGAATLNVNGLGAKAIVKYVSTALATGDIAAGMFCSLIYDGTNFVLQNPIANIPTAGLFTNGVTTRDMTAASGAQTIAHGLGVTPKYIKITAFWDDDTNGTYQSNIQSVGTYNGTTTSCVYFYGNTGPVHDAGDSSTDIIILQLTGSIDSQVATVAFDATNITLTWVKAGSPTRTAYIMWEAQA